MKRLALLSGTLLSVTLVLGCGGGDQPASNSTSTAQPGAEQQAPVPEQTTATADTTKSGLTAETPDHAVKEFLEALRSGDQETTASLLTKKARDETAAHDLVVQPPGAPNATYSVGRVEYGNEQKTTSYVSCVWAEKDGEGQQESFEVVWILRKETAGWRVAGMATQLPDAAEPMVLDFEDLSELEEKMKQAEVAERPATNQAATEDAQVR